jgi:aminoglycoside N3'-acetyltransferase
MLRYLKPALRLLLPRKWIIPLQRLQRRKEAAARAVLRARMRSVHGTFGVEELIHVLRENGIRLGTVLFVQSSFNDLHTFDDSPTALLGCLREVVGPEGTLLMPAFSANMWEGSRIFDVRNEPTYTGIINELFRRSPGVIRSLHPRHSLCGIGPLAQHLLEGHERCSRADGPNSPFDRLRLRQDAYILTLGLPRAFVSILHWVEDYEPDRLPFRIHTARQTVGVVRDEHGREIRVPDRELRPSATIRVNFEWIAEHLSSGAMRFKEYKGVKLGIYPVRELTRELLILRDRRIIHYH